MASLGPLTVEVTPEVGQRDGQGPGGPYCLPRPCLETVEPGEWWDQVCDFLSGGAGMGAGCQLGGCCRVQVAVGVGRGVGGRVESKGQSSRMLLRGTGLDA